MLADGRTKRVKLIMKGKLEQKGNSIQASLWRKNYSDVVNYKFGDDQNELIADEVTTGEPHSHHNIWVFNRETTK